MPEWRMVMKTWIAELAAEWDENAKALDEHARAFIDGSPYNARMRAKAGVYRACAHELRREAKDN
jgi:hypothetical protein